jgi:hypothetical protein
MDSRIGEYPGNASPLLPFGGQIIPKVLKFDSNSPVFGVISGAFNVGNPASYFVKEYNNTIVVWSGLRWEAESGYLNARG